MTLLLDMGNTRIKWARLEDGRLEGQGAATHIEEDLNHALGRAFDGAKPDRVLASNVAGPLLAKAVAELCEKRFNLKPEFLVPAAQACGVTNGYTDPQRLGADRWAAVIGAFHKYGGRHGSPVCVIDAGTAITMDAVDKAGKHLGGLIAPGPQTMRRALAGATASLRGLGEGELALLSRDTSSAVTSGGWYAAAGFVERIASMLAKELGAKPKFVLTGGDAERLAELVLEPMTLAPDIVLQGLAVVAGKRP